MKFDVVVGNPPYNNDIYLKFVETGNKLASQCSVFITPAKWQAKGGEKNEEFRKKIVPHMSKIVYYPDCKDIFDIVETGGISYYLIDEEVHNSIKVSTKINNYLSGEKQTNKIISLYNIYIDNIIKKCSTNSKLMDRMSFSFAYFVKERTWGSNSNTGVELMKGEERVGYICKNELDHIEDVDKYKCVTSAVYGLPFDSNKKCAGTNKINILGPNQVPRNPSVVIKVFNTKEEALSMRSYIYSKLVSFLILIGLTGTSFRSEMWRFVPDPGAFDHIFTDEELYKKYNLTPEEINIIESVIKERK